MNTSSNAFNCSALCFSLCARAGWISPNRPPMTTAAAALTAKPKRKFLLVMMSLLASCWAGLQPVRDTRLENLIAVVPGAGVGLGFRKHILAPHLVGVGEAAVVHGQFAPTNAVEVVAGIGAHHRFGQGWNAFRRVRPRPGGGEHADRTDVADLVVERLVHMAVHVGDVGVAL